MVLKQGNLLRRVCRGLVRLVVDPTSLRREDAERIVLGIRQHDPARVRPLTYFDSASAEREESSDFPVLVVRVQVNVQGTLAAFVTRRPHELNAGKGLTIERDVHDVSGIENNPIVKNSTPKPGKARWVLAIDNHAEPGTRHTTHCAPLAAPGREAPAGSPGHPSVRYRRLKTRVAGRAQIGAFMARRPVTV